MKCLANRPNPINVSFFKIRPLHWRKPRNSNESSSCSQPGRPDCSHLIPAYKKRGVLCCGSRDENTVGLNCNFILLPLYHSALTLKLVHHLGWTSCCFQQTYKQSTYFPILLFIGSWERRGRSMKQVTKISDCPDLLAFQGNSYSNKHTGVLMNSKRPAGPVES